MKLFRSISVLTIALCLMIGSTSCLIFTHHGGGSPRGSSKNSNNPHHPNTTNPGHTKGKKGK
ncbi:MAG: hypothetical protein K0S53_1193 [Bacteroidetes bacterium]|jgi:hypothetical protein|nr:hypothetical protein [Bacteroidota bacterium]